MSPERVAAAVNMRSEHQSVATIARVLGVGASSVARALSRLDSASDYLDMACSQSGFDDQNIRTCPGPHWACPTCGRPTANMNDHAERHDSSYCSPFTPPACYG